MSEAKSTDGSAVVVTTPADTGGHGDGSVQVSASHRVVERSRTSSVSSQASDASMLASPSTAVGRQSSSLMAADDGVSEADNEDHSAVVASMTKEELCHVYSKALRRGHQYKMKYLQVASYNDSNGNLHFTYRVMWLKCTTFG